MREQLTQHGRGSVDDMLIATGHTDIIDPMIQVCRRVGLSIDDVIGRGRDTLQALIEGIAEPLGRTRTKARCQTSPHIAGKNMISTM